MKMRIGIVGGPARWAGTVGRHVGPALWAGTVGWHGGPARMACGLTPLAQHGSLLLGRAGLACYSTRPCQPSPFFFQAEPQAKMGGPAYWTGLYKSQQRNGLAPKFLGRIRQETRRQCLILRQSECYPSSEESIFSFQNEANTVAVSLYPITSGRWDFET